MAQRRTAGSNKASSARQIELYPVNGNTVRAPQEVPQERDYDAMRERRLREAQEREERSRRAARRNHARAMRRNRAYVFFLSVCVCAVFGICFMYIQLQSQATEYKERITALQAEVNDLEADNEEMLQEIETSVDLSEILEKATSELGMTYPSSDQVVTYEADTSDSLTQYADVSSAAGSSLLSGILSSQE